MNKDIQELIDKLKSFDENFDEIIIELAKEKESEIVQMNNDQLNAGRTNENEAVKPQYALRTITRKRRIGQPFDRVTLKDKGDFHESFFIEYREGEFEIKSNDDKRKFLEPKYTKKIYGLTNQNIDILRNILAPLLKKQLVEILIK